MERCRSGLTGESSVLLRVDFEVSKPHPFPVLSLCFGLKVQDMSPQRSAPVAILACCDGCRLLGLKNHKPRYTISSISCLDHAILSQQQKSNYAEEIIFKTLVFPLVNKLENWTSGPKNSFCTKILFFPLKVGKLLVKMKKKSCLVVHAYNPTIKDAKSSGGFL